MTTAAELEAILETNNVEDIVLDHEHEIIEVYLANKEDPNREAKVNLNSKLRWVQEWINSN